MNPPTDSAALLARAVKTWPAMVRYLAEARVGIGLAVDKECGVMVSRMTVIVEVKGENP